MTKKHEQDSVKALQSWILESFHSLHFSNKNESFFKIIFKAGKAPDVEKFFRLTKEVFKGRNGDEVNLSDKLHADQFELTSLLGDINFSLIFMALAEHFGLAKVTTHSFEGKETMDILKGGLNKLGMERPEIDKVISNEGLYLQVGKLLAQQEVDRGQLYMIPNQEKIEGLEATIKKGAGNPDTKFEQGGGGSAPREANHSMGRVNS